MWAGYRKALAPLVAAAVLGCGETRVDGVVVATVDDTPITQAALDRELERLPSAVRERYQEPSQRSRLLDRIVDEHLLLAEGRRRRLHEDPIVRDAVEDLERRLVIDALKQRLHAEQVTDDAVRAYYERNRSEFSEERVRVRQILVRERSQAEELLAALQEGASFEALAEEHSIASSRRRGGDLGTLVRGRMDPGFEKVAFGLRTAGELSGVVETRHGFHLIQLVEPPARETRPYDEARLAIEAKLKREAVSGMLANLREGASIQIHRSSPES